MNKTRIFLIDDHPLVRDWLSLLLQQQPDFEVCGQAGDARAGLAGLQAVGADIAIVDLTLGTDSGLELIKTIREQFPSVQVVVLSMHEEIGYAERALRAGARAYVTKRESSGKIVEAIREVLAGRLHANPALLAQLAERIYAGTNKAGVDRLDLLSDRELEVFQRLGNGIGTRAIAVELRVSLATVQTYCMRIKDKLGLDNGSELVREAVRWVEDKRKR